MHSNNNSNVNPPNLYSSAEKLIKELKELKDENQRIEKFYQLAEMIVPNKKDTKLLLTIFKLFQESMIGTIWDCPKNTLCFAIICNLNLQKYPNLLTKEALLPTTPFSIAARFGYFNHFYYMYNQINSSASNQEKIQLLQESLYQAVRYGQVDCAKNLILYFPSAINEDIIKYALHIFSDKNEFAMTNFLISNLKNPLTRAVEYGNIETLKYLLKAYTNLEASKYCSLFKSAAETIQLNTHPIKNYLDIMIFLINQYENKMKGFLTLDEKDALNALISVISGQEKMSHLNQHQFKPYFSNRRAVKDFAGMYQDLKPLESLLEKEYEPTHSSSNSNRLS